MSFISDGIGDMIVRTIIAAFIIGALFATLMFFGIPWIWGYLKPLIHTLTA